MSTQTGDLFLFSDIASSSLLLHGSVLCNFPFYCLQTDMVETFRYWNFQHLGALLNNANFFTVFNWAFYKRSSSSAGINSRDDTFFVLQTIFSSGVIASSSDVTSVIPLVGFVQLPFLKASSSSRYWFKISYIPYFFKRTWCALKPKLCCCPLGRHRQLTRKLQVHQVSIKDNTYLPELPLLDAGSGP